MDSELSDNADNVTANWNNMYLPLLRKGVSLVRVATSYQKIQLRLLDDNETLEYQNVDNHLTSKTISLKGTY